MNFVRALVGATLVTLALSGCARPDLQATRTDQGTADGLVVVAVAVADNDAGAVGVAPSVGATPTAGVTPTAGTTPTARATATAEPSPADGVISDWGTPITLATFLVVVVGGVVAYMVSRRSARQADQAQA